MKLCWRCGAPLETNRLPMVAVGIGSLLIGVLGGAALMSYTNLGMANAEPSATASAKRAAAEMPDPAKPVATGWQKVAGWKGSGAQRTPKFTIANAQWRIKWATTAAQPGCVFQMYVRNDSNEAVGLPTTAAGTASDFSYMRTPPGEYTLEIASANCGWTVDVEDWR